MNDEINKLKEQLIQSMFRIKKLTLTFPTGMETNMEKLNISMTELALMKTIEENHLDSDKNTYISDIQNNLFITKAAVSQMLGVLEKKGYLNRDIDKLNRRTLIITLTQNGRDVLKSVEKDFSNMLGKIIICLGKDNTEQFIKSINLLENAIKEVVV